MLRSELCTLLPPEDTLVSNTGADVVVVSDGHSLWVRKNEVGSHSLDRNQETSQSVAAFLDHYQFNNGAQMAYVGRCSQNCINQCNKSPFIEGQCLSDLLGDDNSGIREVSELRMRLLESMKRGGYFAQRSMGRPYDYYQTRFLKYEKVNEWFSRSGRLEIGGQQIDVDAKRALDFLCHSNTVVPVGVFPTDLNLTNVIYRSSDRSIRTIDQCLAYVSPAIPITKMIIGWRGFGSLVPRRPNWSLISLNELSQNIELTMECDRDYLKKCLIMYDWLDEPAKSHFEAEIHGIQIMKTFITLNKFKERGQLPPQEAIDAVIGPFYERTLNRFVELMG